MKGETPSALSAAEPAYVGFLDASKFIQEHGYKDWDGSASGQSITLTGCANMMKDYAADLRSKLSTAEWLYKELSSLVVCANNTIGLENDVPTKVINNLATPLEDAEAKLSTAEREQDEWSRVATERTREHNAAEAELARKVAALQEISKFTVMNSRDAGYVINASAVEVAEEALRTGGEPGGTK